MILLFSLGRRWPNPWKLLEKLRIMTHSLLLCLNWWFSYKAGRSQAQGVKMSIFHEMSSWTMKFLTVMWTVTAHISAEKDWGHSCKERFLTTTKYKDPHLQDCLSHRPPDAEGVFWACSTTWAHCTHTASCVSVLLSLRTTISMCGKFPWKGYQIFYRKPNGRTPANRLVTAAKTQSFSRR